MKTDEIKNLSIEDLRSNLITCDYRGKEIKSLILNELINREVDIAVKEFHQSRLEVIS